MANKKETSSAQQLYGVTGLFEKPDDIMHAASTVAESGYTAYDVHSPYPVHGMDDAMQLGPSRIGYLVFGIGTTFITLMVLFIYWVVAIDYPLVVAGKPFFSLPAYVPVLFEVTVLSSAVLGTLAMLCIYNGLPFNSHPLHDTPYMARVSDNRFGICLQATDPLFTEDSAKELLQKLGALDITSIYLDPEEQQAKSKLKPMTPQFAMFLALVAIATNAAVYVLYNKVVYMAPFTWMDVQAKERPQSRSKHFEDGFAMRVPVAGTVPRGFVPYPYQEANVEEASPYMVNPLPRTKEVLALGKKQFESKCSACHGYSAEGDSRLKATLSDQLQFPAPPSLLNQKVADWTDGRIYHIISVGQNNIMPGYARNISRDDRWAIVHYVRALQRAFNPKDTDAQQ